MRRCLLPSPFIECVHACSISITVSLINTNMCFRRIPTVYHLQYPWWRILSFMNVEECPRGPAFLHATPIFFTVSRVKYNFCASTSCLLGRMVMFWENDVYMRGHSNSSSSSNKMYVLCMHINTRMWYVVIDCKPHQRLDGMGARGQTFNVNTLLEYCVNQEACDLRAKYQPTRARQGAEKARETNPRDNRIRYWKTTRASRPISFHCLHWTRTRGIGVFSLVIQYSRCTL